MIKPGYKRLGDYIEPLDERNTTLSVKLSQGICNNKYFITPRQVAENSANDKIVRTGQFAYNRATTRNGDKISIAYREGPDCTVSSAYQIFRIKDENKLNPHYLWLWFSRPEFDRYARFKSRGSAHEFFEWDEMCEVYLPIPEITEQRRIVSEYQAVEARIDTNKDIISKYEETAQTIYKKMFVDGINTDDLPEGWHVGSLSDFGKVVTGKTPSSECPEDFGDDYPFITPGDFTPGEMFLIKTERALSEIGKKKLSGKLLHEGDIAVTCIGYVGKVAVVSKDSISNQQINSIAVKQPIYTHYLYYYIQSIKQVLEGAAVGSSTLPLLNKSDFENIAAVIPPQELLEAFAHRVKALSDGIKSLLMENIVMANMLKLLLSKLSVG